MDDIADIAHKADRIAWAIWLRKWAEIVGIDQETLDEAQLESLRRWFDTGHAPEEVGKNV